MAGDWIKMRGNLWDDPRVSKLCDLTDQSEAAIVGALYWLWAAADQHTEDGLMPGLTLRQIDRKTGVQGFGAALCQIGWLEDNPDGVRIVNFEEHNGTSAKRRCTDAQRKANVRNVSASDADKQRTESGQKTPNLGAREEKSREEEKKNTPQPPTGAFEAFWECWPKNERKQDKAKCSAKWERDSLDTVAEAIVADVSAKKHSQKWRDGFIEAPMVYLNNRRWEDGAAGAATGPKRGTDEYAALHKSAGWWREAGFPTIWDAMASKCWHDNAHEFRDGKRVEVAA